MIPDLFPGLLFGGYGLFVFVGWHKTDCRNSPTRLKAERGKILRWRRRQALMRINQRRLLDSFDPATRRSNALSVKHR